MKLKFTLCANGVVYLSKFQVKSCIISILSLETKMEFPGVLGFISSFCLKKQMYKRWNLGSD